MKPKIKQYITFVAIFISGLVVGVLGMGYLSERASKTFVELYRANYSREQIYLAAQARYRGEKYSEFTYRHNAVNILPYGKLETIKRMKTAWTIFFPFSAPGLDRMMSYGSTEKSEKTTYGIELARLAEATENIGLKDEAAKLWSESAKLLGHSDVAKVRFLVSTLNKMDEKEPPQYP